MVNKITPLIPENDEYLMHVKACMLSDAAQLTVKVAGAEAARGVGPFDKDPDDDISFFGFEEDPEEHYKHQYMSIFISNRVSYQRSKQIVC